MKSRLLLILFLALAPCLLRAQTDVALRPDSAAQTTAPGNAPQSGGGGVALRVGDIIELRLSGVPVEESTAFNAIYTIDDQGMVNLPYINQVKVAGLLPNEIQQAIQNRLMEAKIFTHPTITIQQSTPRFVNINGEVRAPQRVPYTADMTLITVIDAAGGFTDYANKKKVELKHEGKVTVFNTESIRKGGTEDPKVVPGDQIHVQASFW
jgi:protein involved in polysaccharide export with SLBB domain